MCGEFRGIGGYGSIHAAFDLQSLHSDEPLQRGDPGCVDLDRVRCDGFVVKRSGLELLDPDTDQIARQLMSIGQAVERLAGKILLHDLTIELDSACAMSNHGLPSFETPAARSMPCNRSFNTQGRAPRFFEPSGPYANRG